MKQLLPLSIILSALLITGCSTAAMDDQKAAVPPDESAINTYWKLVTLDGKPIVTQENFREAHLVFHSDASRLAGSTGCNTLIGNYHLENKRIAFAQFTTTKMVCPPPQMETEHAFLEFLKQVTTWDIDGATLFLSGDNDEQPLANFEAVHLY